MARQAALFAETPKPRIRRMHVVDAGMPEGGRGHMVRFACSHCGSAETEWMWVATISEAKRGLPCPACNPNIHQAPEARRYGSHHE